MKRTRKVLATAGLVFGVCLLLVLAVVAEENVRGFLRLRRTVQRLRAQGEPLTVAEMHLPPVPNDGNAAPALEQAARELEDLTKKNPVAGEGPHGLMTPAKPGRALVKSHEAVFPTLHALGQPSRDGKPPVYSWPQVESELANGEIPLARLREALRQPVVVPTVDYADIKLAPSHTWKSSFWLASVTLDDLHREDHEAAAANLAAMLNLAGYLEKDRHSTQQVMANTTEAFALALVWEALQDEGWTDAQLDTVQAALVRQHPMDDALGSLAYELVLVRMYFDQLRQSSSGRAVSLRLAGHNLFNDLLGNEEPKYPSEGAVLLRSALWRALWADQDEAHVLERWERFLPAAHRLLSGKSWGAFARVDPELAPPSRGLASWVYSFSDVLDPRVYRSLLERFVRVETQRQMALAAVAIKRHALRHGAPPPSLEALVPEFLSALPTDWMDGQPLRYRPLADGKTFLLYSVGADGHDDGGDPTPAAGAGKHKDMWTGRDAVWPVAVTPLDVAPVPPAASP